MFPYITKVEDKQWQAGPYEGVELLVLRKDEQSGGVTVLRKFKAGTIVPAHTHPLANESVFVVSGEWVEEGVSYGPGSYFYVSKGQKHGPHVAKNEVISLTTFDGPLTVA